MKNEKCVISDSALCKWLDKECAECYINDIKKEDEAEKALEIFEVMMSLLPESFDDLQSEECCFCTGEKNKRAGYANISLGHSEPEHKKGMFFGIGKKVRQRIGSLMPLSISICKECRRSFRMIEALKWIGIIVFMAVAIILIVIPSVGTAITNVSPALPYGVLIAGALIGYIVGKLAASGYMKAQSRRMVFNVFDVPVCDEMERRGWFVLQDDGPVTRFLFSKKSKVKKLADIRKKDEM